MINASAVALDSRTFPDEKTSWEESVASGVSWSAVAGGAFVSAALSVILLALGTGLGLSSVSPWSNTGASASAIGTASILWLIAMQVISSGMGGYLAGRLRTKWAAVHTDEVYFRDTAHGFLVWCVGLVITASFLASAAASMVGGSTAGQGARAEGGAEADQNAYFVDTLLRTGSPTAYDAPAHAEVGRIMAVGLRGKDLSASDRAYLGQIVVARTGMSQADAERRVNEVITQARESVDEARKVGAHLLLWLFIALLIGAFCASYAATIGGRQRDHVRAL